MILNPLTISIYISIGVLALIAYVDPWVRLVLYIAAETIYLNVRKLPLYLKLRWEIFWIMRSKNRYLKEAEKIMKELQGE